MQTAAPKIKGTGTFKPPAKPSDKEPPQEAPKK